MDTKNENINDFNYQNIEVKKMTGGSKIVRKVSIKNGKGYKSVCLHKHGKKCHNNKKHLTKSEIQMIKMGKFIPGLFSNCKSCSRKRRG